MWDDEAKAYLREIVVGRSHNEIAELMQAKFGDGFTKSIIKGAINRYKLNTGRTGRYEKGMVPFNKGKTGYMGANRTSFQKGQTPHNHVDVGTELVKADGYLWTKIAEPKKWKQTHRIVWEKNNGLIPKGQVVIFADGNRLNVDIDNLLLVDRSDLVRINQMGVAGLGKELTEQAIALAKLQNTIGKTRRRKEQHA